MKLDHSEPVLSFEGNTIPHQGAPGEEARDLTYRDLVIMSLNNTTDASENLTGEQKIRLFMISTKFYREGDNKVELTIEEAATVKERGGKFLSALAYGRLCEWLGDLPSSDDPSD